ncbi:MULTISPECIES: hypothetical protein [unclassified Arthrobacter]|uniref:hypothetical protein n=1 Tax=unclassified Arthrobacter TaxID=235627 RepID=UPI002E11F773|nr:MULTISPECIES: hypothetical protein [unclassified Arthrobacter]
MSETPEQAERRHSDAPAEGERAAGGAGAGADERAHSQDPAEGETTEADSVESDGS